jgi:Flp pilus assembly protein CpaB
MTNDNSKDLLSFVVPLIILIGVGGFMLLKLWSAPEPQVNETVEPTQSRIVSKRKLNSFTKLTSADLEVSSGIASASMPTIGELEGRYLLVPVMEGGEVKREMVAPREATLLLSDAVAVGIQPTSLASIGGQLHAGDIVDVVAIGLGDRPASGNTQSLESLESVLVLNVVNDAKAGDKGSGIPVGITLAIPRGSRDKFAAAAANAGIVVTRKIIVAN